MDIPWFGCVKYFFWIFIIPQLKYVTGESKEVFGSNPWLNYSESFNRMREFGVSMKEIDLLDEHPLSMESMRSVCAMLFQVSPSSLPHPETEKQAFLQTVKQLNDNDQQHIYALYTKKYGPLINMDKLHQAVNRIDICQRCNIS